MKDRSSPGPTDRTPAWLQRLAIIGTLAAVALVVVGAVMLATAKNGGSVVFTVGVIGLVLYGAMIPLSRRKNPT
ncbi:MAG TPA: hypothetical protein VHW92_11145 [Mycobacteriales bacterium]|jgi:hypothetical protein|nr:hypothetical protein [Mycobacteriales bacterium]